MFEWGGGGPKEVWVKRKRMAYLNLKDTKYEIYFDFHCQQGGGQPPPPVVLSGGGLDIPPSPPDPPPPDRNPDVISSRLNPDNFNVLLKFLIAILIF